MDTALVVWSAASASIGSLLTGYVLKRIEHNRNLRDVGRLEVDRRRHIDRYEAVKEIHGLGRALHHYALHPTGNISVADIRQTAPQMRKIARSNVEVVREAYVAAVLNFTDQALHLADHAERYDEKSPEEQLPSARRSLLGTYAFEDAWDTVLSRGMELLK